MARKSSVDKLKEDLYSRVHTPKIDPENRTPFSPERDETPRAWSDIRTSSPDKNTTAAAGTLPPPDAFPAMVTKKKRGHSPSFYFLLCALVFFIAAAGFAFFTYYKGGNVISPQNIDVEIVAPGLIGSGKEATLKFLISNKNDATLEAADLVIDYPEGTREGSSSAVALTHQRISLGDIAPGAQVEKTVPVIFYGAEGTTDAIDATLEYGLAGSNATFTRASNTMVAIGSAPVVLTIDAPSEAISDQPFSMDITVASNSDSPIQNVAVQAQYPFGFTPQDSTPSADVGTTLWRLGTLDPGDSKTIHLTGVLDGEDGDERVFHFLAGSESDLTESTLAVPLLSVSQTLTVRRPFLSGEISLNGQTGSTIVAPIGQSVSGEINWQNNASTTLNNVVFTLSLAGTPLVPASVSGDGFYNSNTSQIVWSSQQDGALASVPPGASGVLSFTFATYPPSKETFTNPKVTLNLTAKATRVDENQVPTDVSSAASATVNFTSAVSIAAVSEHNADDTGPTPPQVGQQSTYTVAWSAESSSNTIAGSKVAAVLPVYVTYEGSESPGEQISYDSTTRTVVWNIGDLQAGAGYSAPARQAAFRISLAPSLSQVGQQVALTGSATFSGQDRFSKQPVSATAPAPTTVLNNDYTTGTVAE